ncbi:MAG: AbrB/MazE/SpoVT family DNA-binding domain-containing protein [Allorhizobium sp.]
MARLKVSADGEVTLEKALLDHLGVKPGDELQADLLPGSRVAVHAAEGDASLEAFFGMFKHKGERSFSIEEINDAIAAGYAGEVDV